MTGIGLWSHFILALLTTRLTFLRVSFIISPYLVPHCSILDLVSLCAPFTVVDSAIQVRIVNVRHPCRHRPVPRSRLLRGGDHGASPRWRWAFQHCRLQPWLSHERFGVDLVHPTRADDLVAGWNGGCQHESVDVVGFFKGVWNYFRFLPRLIHFNTGRGIGIFHNRLGFASLVHDIRKKRLGVAVGCDLHKMRTVVVVTLPDGLRCVACPRHRRRHLVARRSIVLECQLCCEKCLHVFTARRH